MNDLNTYVKETDRKIRELEKSTRKSKSTASSYAATIKKLKNDLEKNEQGNDCLTGIGGELPYGKSKPGTNHWDAG
jgi:hypothetical protein